MRWPARLSLTFSKITTLCRSVCGLHVPGIPGRSGQCQPESCPSGSDWKWPELYGRSPELHLQLLRAMYIHRHSLFLILGLGPSCLQGQCLVFLQLGKGTLLKLGLPFLED